MTTTPNIPSTVSSTNSKDQSTTGIADQMINNQISLLNGFTFEMFKKLFDPSEDKNKVLSPFNVYTALLLAYEGSNGSTRREIGRVLGIDSESDHCQRIRYLLELLKSSSGESDLEVAFSTWLQKDFPFRDEYINRVTECYNAEVMSVDFSREWSKTVKLINMWVEEKTRNFIRELVPEDYPEYWMIRSILISTLFLNASWPEKFIILEEPAPFWTGTEYVNVTMMSTELSTKAYLNDEVIVIEIPYSMSNLSFVIIMPEELGSFIRELDWNELSTIIERLNNSKPRQMRITIPKFKIEGDRIELKPVLVSMGIREIFEPGVSDLTRMAQVRKGELYVDDVLHKAYIEVNENGTIAAAATAIIIKIIAYIPPELEVRIDRPFIFYILDKSSGLILFTGYVTQPEY